MTASVEAAWLAGMITLVSAAMNWMDFEPISSHAVELQAEQSEKPLLIHVLLSATLLTSTAKSAVQSARAHHVYIQLQYSLLLHLGLQPPPKAMVLPQAPAVHATQRILLELTTHNSNALGVHFPHTFQQICNCGIVICHSIQLVLRPLFLHRQAQTHCYTFSSSSWLQKPMQPGEVHVLLHSVGLTNGQAECFLSKLTGFESIKRLVSDASFAC